jgi:hypothetical protein
MTEPLVRQQQQQQQQMDSDERVMWRRVMPFLMLATTLYALYYERRLPSVIDLMFWCPLFSFVLLACFKLACFIGVCLYALLIRDLDTRYAARSHTHDSGVK